MKYKHYTKYSIEEKNAIVLLYLDKHIRAVNIVEMYNIGHKRILYNWVRQYKEFGTTVDNRGKASPNKAKGRTKKKKELKDYSWQELYELALMTEDIKKSVACLVNSKQKTNFK